MELDSIRTGALARSPKRRAKATCICASPVPAAGALPTFRGKCCLNDRGSRLRVSSGTSRSDAKSAEARHRRLASGTRAKGRRCVRSRRGERSGPCRSALTITGLLGKSFVSVQFYTDSLPAISTGSYSSSPHCDRTSRPLMGAGRRQFRIKGRGSMLAYIWEDGRFLGFDVVEWLAWLGAVSILALFTLAT